MCVGYSRVASWYSMLRGYSTGKGSSIWVRSPYRNLIRERRLIIPAPNSIAEIKHDGRPSIERGRRFARCGSVRCGRGCRGIGGCQRRAQSEGGHVLHCGVWGIVIDMFNSTFPESSVIYTDGMSCQTNQHRDRNRHVQLYLSWVIGNLYGSTNLYHAKPINIKSEPKRAPAWLALPVTVR